MTKTEQFLLGIAEEIGLKEAFLEHKDEITHKFAMALCEERLANTKVDRPTIEMIGTNIICTTFETID